MKKKLLEKDGFYLALFACICLVAVGGIWFTNNNVDELASSNELVNKNSENDDELHLIENETNNEEDVVPTTTDSEENLQQAKEEEEKTTDSKLAFLGTEVVREYSENEPSYSKTLDVWEIHKGLDVSSEVGQEVKSLLSGQVVNIFNDDEHGVSVEIKSEEDITVIYSNLDEEVSVEKGKDIKEGQVIGKVGQTTFVEIEDGTHVHIEAFKGKESIDPMDLIQ